MAKLQKNELTQLKLQLKHMESYADHIPNCSFVNEADPEMPTYGLCNCGLFELLNECGLATPFQIRRIYTEL